jgi:hypothetical protein
MFRAVVACVLFCLVAYPVAAQKAVPKKDPPPEIGAVTEEMAAARTILNACTEVAAATTPEALEHVTGELLAKHIVARDHLESQRHDLMSEWVRTAREFVSLRNWVFRDMMDIALAANDFERHQQIQREAAKPVVIEKLGELIDLAAGDGTADALQNPFLDTMLDLDQTLTNHIEREQEAKVKAIAARRTLVALDARLTVARLIVTGIYSCINEQEIYVAYTTPEGAAPADISSLEESGGYRMDKRFSGGTPERTIDMPPSNGDIAYSPGQCHDICMSEASCVGWNYLYPAMGQGLGYCQILDGADDVASSHRPDPEIEHLAFSGFGPKAVELGLARADDGID